MLKRRVHVRLLIALVSVAAALFETPAYGQDPNGPQAQADTTTRDSTKAKKNGILERYNDGIIIWQTPDTASVPFLLRFNVNTQIRYLNTTGSDASFTDHLGVVRDVHRRNDITVNRTMFILGGYIFDKRLRYSSTVWTSAGSASIVIA